MNLRDARGLPMSSSAKPRGRVGISCCTVQSSTVFWMRYATRRFRSCLWKLPTNTPRQESDKDNLVRTRRATNFCRRPYFLPLVSRLVRLDRTHASNSYTRENRRSRDASTQNTLQDSSATFLSAIILTFLSSVLSRPKNLAMSMI